MWSIWLYVRFVVFRVKCICSSLHLAINQARAFIPFPFQAIFMYKYRITRVKFTGYLCSHARWVHKHIVQHKSISRIDAHKCPLARPQSAYLKRPTPSATTRKEMRKYAHIIGNNQDLVSGGLGNWNISRSLTCLLLYMCKCAEWSVDICH